MRNTILTLLLLFAATFAASAQRDACPPPYCECVDGLSELQLYYFGEAGSTVDIVVSTGLSGSLQIATFEGISSGDAFTVSAAVLPGGQFTQYTNFEISNVHDKASCNVRIYTRCPTNAWPNATDDQQILGKQHGPLFVAGYTSAGNDQVCGLEDIEQYWRVGGNVLPPEGGAIGSLNDAPVQFITGNLLRATLDNAGNLKLGDGPASAQLHVAEDARIDGAADIYGRASVHDDTPSGSPAQGALTVSGGAGIGQNLNVGQHLGVGGNANIAENAGVGSNLSVGGNADIAQNTNVGNNLLVNGNASVVQNAGIGNDLNVGGNANVVQSAGVGSNLSVGQNASVGNSLDVNGTATVGGNANIGGNMQVLGTAAISGFTTISNSARVEGDLGLIGSLNFGLSGAASVRHSGGQLALHAENEEMVIVSGTQVEVKRRLIVTGADLAERFTVNEAGQEVLPGMVLSIDAEREGQLAVSQQPYDRAVAGIVSGAGGIETAMLLGQAGTLAYGDVPVAITGRVYCYVDADYAPVKPGDLLTTSATFGHAMKASDYEQARGAIIGKAMTALPAGKGLVLVLIGMQ